MHYINSVVIKPEAMVLWKGRLTVLNCHTRLGLFFPFYNLMYAPIMCHSFFPFPSVCNLPYDVLLHFSSNWTVKYDYTHRRRNKFSLLLPVTWPDCLISESWDNFTHKWDPHVDSAWPNIRHNRISRHHPILNSSNAYARPSSVCGLNVKIQHLASIIQPDFCLMIHLKQAATNWFGIWLWTYP